MPYEGEDTKAFDDLVFDPETALNVVHSAKSQWGTHLVLIEARGGPPSAASLVAQASDLVDQAMGGARAGGEGGVGGFGDTRRAAKSEGGAARGRGRSKQSKPRRKRRTMN